MSNIIPGLIYTTPNIKNVTVIKIILWLLSWSITPGPNSLIMFGQKKILIFECPNAINDC